jgi:TRAP-type mannitol/chloroaromatic compound transport system substrate-binding protein
VEMQTKDKVRFYKTPDSVLQRQLDIFDTVLAKYSEQTPMFKEIAESQRQFAQRAVKWFLDTQVGSRMAYNHYFAKPAAKPAAPAAKPEPKKS